MEAAENITVEQLAGVLRRRWVIPVILALVGAAAAFAVSLQTPQSYRASASVLVGGSESVPLIGSISSPQSLSAATAADLIHTRTVAALVQHALPTTRSTSDLLSRVGVSANSQSGIVTVTGHGASGVEAAAIANGFASEFVKTRAAAPYIRLTKAVTAVKAQLKSVPRTGAEHAALASQLRQLRALAALPTSDAQVVDRAVPARSPSSPRVVADTLSGLGVGLLLGLLAAFVLEALDPRVKTSDELHRLVPMPQLAGVPLVAFRRGFSLRKRVRKQPRVLTVAKQHGESFERLRTSLLVFNGERELKTVLVTSPTHEKEGKTTVAANLAVALGKIGLRVCVVDADLRRPRLARYFGFENSERGLVDVLGGAPLESAISRFPLPSAPVLNGNGDGPLQPLEIGVLPAGKLTAFPAELLASKQMQTTIDELESLYDIVVLDCAPLLAASDAMPLVARSCGTVLVVRLFQTPRKAAVRAVRVIERAHGSLMGVVATGVPPRELREEGFGPWPAESVSSVAARVS
ncbi:MAG TPA: AAA family ATPase [Gaiellaceae bacterium]|nr:AAA family ATPase [Gaiellaceae bacterium]